MHELKSIENVYGEFRSIVLSVRWLPEWYGMVWINEQDVGNK